MVHLLLVIIYLAFISLGLPDALLGAAWPMIYPEIEVPVSYAGIIYMIISFGTVISSLQSDRLTKKLGTGMVTALSVATTAVALFGFSMSHSFWMLCLWAIPYGLGAGSVDASINNYVALHYSSKHMSWLHCMWGVGISIGPYVLTYALSNGMIWNTGYRYICFMQVALTICIMLSLPLWKKPSDAFTGVDKDKSESQASDKPLKLKEIIALKGAKEVMIAFFCYCALEQTAILWGSSFLVLGNGFSEERASGLASMFCIGITAGRGLSGFMTMKFNDKTMIRMGAAVILVGIISLFLPFGEITLIGGLILIGFGCAPVYPCIIHSTPALFGADKSQAIIGVQMASAYVGTTLMPPLFGLIANHVDIRLLPVYLLMLLVAMVFMIEKLNKRHAEA